MRQFLTQLEKFYLGAIIVIGICWVIDVPQYFGISLISAEWMGLLLSVGIAASLLHHPYGKQSGLLEAALGIFAIASWCWMSLNYSDWIVDFFGSTPEKYLPGIVAVVLLMEALRKAAGLPITILVWILIVYGFFGYLLPQPFEAEQLQVLEIHFRNVPYAGK